jgi:hypothetical protein
MYENSQKNLRRRAFSSAVTFSFLKSLPFEDSFHLRKEKNAVRKILIVLKRPGEVLASC